MSDFLLKELEKYGIPPPQKEVGYDKFTRWGKSNEFFAIRLRSGNGYFFGNFKESEKGHAVFEHQSKSDAKELHQAMQILKREKNHSQKRVSEDCSRLWESLKPIFTHPYLTSKKVDSYGLRIYHEKLVIPLRDINQRIWSLQFISADGSKIFKTGGRKTGCFFTIGAENLTSADKIYIAEGYATAATIYKCTEIPTIVAFDAGNLESVALEIRRKYKKSKIIICADNDAYGSQNTGLTKAKQAAEKVGGIIKFPTFKDTSTKPTDFNDLFILEGKDAVLAQILDDAKSEKITSDEKNCIDGFKLTEDALSYFDEKKQKYFKICSPIYVTAITQELEDKNLGRLIEFKDRIGNPTQVLILDSWLSKDGSKIHDILYKNGLDIDTSGRVKQRLNEYINKVQPEQIITYTVKSGWYNKAFLTATEVFGSTDKKIIHVPTTEPAKISYAGTLLDWQNNIAALCVNNSRLMLAISAAFASIILTPCGADNFFLHFFGKSSQGKTTMLDVAASVFGNHDFTKTWRTTDNALEGTALAHNDLCLFLDEIGECDPNKIGNIAYMLVNGTGKSRATSQGMNRKLMRWTLGGISTGEVPVADVIKLTGRTPKAGQLLRILSIPAVPENGYGLFEDLHDFPDSAEFAEYLLQASNQYHGTAFRAFVTQVIKNFDYIKEFYKSELRKAKEKYLPPNASGQDYRAFKTFATCGIGGLLATKYEITGWNGIDVMETIMLNFQSWLESKGGAGSQEDKQALAQIQLFFEKYGATRFQELISGEDPSYDRPPHERAGFRTERYGEPIYYIFKNYFEEIIARGLDLNHVKKLLRDKGILETDKDHSRFDKVVRIGSNLKRLYVINHKIFEGAEND